MTNSFRRLDQRIVNILAAQPTLYHSHLVLKVIWEIIRGFLAYRLLHLIVYWRLKRKAKLCRPQPILKVCSFIFFTFFPNFHTATHENYVPRVSQTPTPGTYNRPSQTPLNVPQSYNHSQRSISGGPATTIATQAPPSVITEPARGDTLTTPSVTPAQRANSFPSAAQTGASPTFPKITARSGSKNRREAIIAPRRSALNKIYPALLSRVAETFKSQLPLSEKVKDDLTYTEAFDGSQAVDLLCQIIRTTDRNIALLLGRSLDAQKFFHDVHWEHRLRDSDKEIYRFKERIPSPIFADGENTPVDIDDDDDLDDSESPKGSNSLAPAKVSIPSRSASMPSRFKNKKSSVNRKDKLATSNKQPRSSAPIDFTYNEADGSEVKDSSSSAAINELPTGVFTLLTACYSPTCTKDRLCYSITCPRRIEQQHRMANRSTIRNSEGSLKRSTTKKVAKNVLTRENIGEEPVIEETITEGLNELNVGVGEEASDGVVKAELGSSSNIASDRASGQLWVESVPKEVVESCSSDEIKRQEAINEVIYTEQDFVRDLEYLRDVGYVCFCLNCILIITPVLDGAIELWKYNT